MQMKNCVPALSGLFGTSTADTAPRVCFSAFGSGFEPIQAAGAIALPRGGILRQRVAALDDAVPDHAVEHRAVVAARRARS